MILIVAARFYCKSSKQLQWRGQHPQSEQSTGILLLTQSFQTIINISAESLAETYLLRQLYK